MVTTSGIQRHLGGAIIALAGLIAADAALAQAYPAKPIETIVPYSTGGGVSAMARAFAAEASKVTNVSWVVSNREGGGGVVGFGVLARARPDGYVVAFSPASPLTNSPFINPNMPFKNDQFTPVCQIFENVFAIAVKEDSPIKSLADLIAEAKRRPGEISYGHAGPASIAHMSVAAIERDTGVRFNAVAYQGDGPMMMDTLGGTLGFSAAGISSLSGKALRIIAVFADTRHPTLPNVPSVKELGYKSVTPGLNGLYVPAGTPASVVSYLEDVCQKVTASQGFIDSARTLMQVPAYLPAAKFAARIDETYKMHAALVPDLKLDRN